MPGSKTLSIRRKSFAVATINLVAPWTFSLPSAKFLTTLIASRRPGTDYKRVTWPEEGLNVPRGHHYKSATVFIFMRQEQGE